MSFFVVEWPELHIYQSLWLPLRLVYCFLYWAQDREELCWSSVISGGTFSSVEGSAFSLQQNKRLSHSKCILGHETEALLNRNSSSSRNKLKLSTEWEEESSSGVLWNNARFPLWWLFWDVRDFSLKNSIIVDNQYLIQLGSGRFTELCVSILCFV